MYELTNPSVIKMLCKKHSFFFKKSLGQNFLTDNNVITNTIEAAGINGDSYVIEIGPGFGNLTGELCKVAKKVLAFEIDSALIDILKDTLCEFDNVKVINEDILKSDLHTILSEEGQDIRFTVVANLPYYITSPIIMELLTKKLPIDRVVIMVQKEVAQRIAATCGNKDYGALTIAVRYYGLPRIAFFVPAQSFVPEPKVDSAVIVIDTLANPPFEVKSEKMFFSVVKAAFAQRRKTLRNALQNSGFFISGKQDIDIMLKELGVREDVRGEALSPEQIAALSNMIYEFKK